MAKRKSGEAESEATSLTARAYESLAAAHKATGGRAWTAGAIVTVLAALIGTIASPAVGEAPFKFCATQNANRGDVGSKLDTRISLVKSHIAELEAEDKAHPSAATAKAIVVENEYMNSLTDQKARLEGSGRGVWNRLQRWLVYLPSLVASFGMALLARRQRNGLFPERDGSSDVLKGWVAPWSIAWAIPGALVWITEALAGSSPEKRWFGWDSLCVSWIGFLSSQVAITGTFIAAAVPISLFYCLFRPERRPRFDKDSSDLPTAIQRYLAAAETCALWGLAIVFAFAVFWLSMATRHASKATFERIYLLPVASLVVPAAVVGMIIISAHRIRNDYRTWREHRLLTDPKATLPDDPTVRFLGENTLKLPGTIAAVTGLAWYVLEKLHVLDVLF